MEKLRKIRDEKEARRCVAAARAAGNLGQWARAHGYDGRSLLLEQISPHAVVRDVYFADRSPGALA